MTTTPHDDGRLADLERLLDVARQLGATVAIDPLLGAIAAAATSLGSTHGLGCSSITPPLPLLLPHAAAQ